MTSSPPSIVILLVGKRKKKEKKTRILIPLKSFFFSTSNDALAENIAFFLGKWGVTGREGERDRRPGEGERGKKGKPAGENFVYADAVNYHPVCLFDGVVPVCPSYQVPLRSCRERGTHPPSPLRNLPRNTPRWLSRSCAWLRALPGKISY